MSESGTNYEKVAPYQGKYIAIVDSKIIASGSTSGEVMRITAQKIPHSHPVIMKVPNNGLTL